MIRDISSLTDEGNICIDSVEVLETQLELVYRELVGLEVLGDLSGS